MADILIAVTDGLKRIGEALAAVFPATTLQTCIVHLIRNRKIFQRIVPLLVTVEMTDRPWRLLFTRTTGVWPWGA